MACNKAKVAIGFMVAGVLAVISGTVLTFVGPIIIDDQVVKNTVIDSNNDLTYPIWRNVPVPFFMSVYFFNVLNPDEILAGEKPMLEQKGPYVYRKRLQKDNITFHDNDTVSYREYRSYYFEPSMSAGNESDIVTIPNMLVLGAAVMMESRSVLIRRLVSSTIGHFKEGAFITKSVGELMWGYDSKLVDFLKKYLPGQLPISGKFGLFSEFNNSNTGLFTIGTGKKDIRDVHRVHSWNGLTELTYWRTPQCNMINGTAGQMWPPFMTEESTLPFYSPDSCRSLELVYERDGEMHGIPLYRFVAPKTMFANGNDYTPNEGFCPCRQSGLLNVSSCRFGSPMFISQPHFFNGDPKLLDYVHGLNPNKDQHGLFIDIHPLTGVPLNVTIRLQLNIYTKKVEGFKQTGEMPEMVLPMIWFGESGYIDGPILNTFHTNLVVLPLVMEYMQYGFIALGLATILIAAFVYRRARISKPNRQTTEGVMSSSDGEREPLLPHDTH